MTDLSNDVSTRHQVTNGHLLGRLIHPFLGVVKGLDVHTTGHKHSPGHLGNGFERALDSIKDVVQDACTKKEEGWGKEGGRVEWN